MVIRNPAQDPVSLQPFTEPKPMTIALGYSVGNFIPASPDRLCRGRERWITAPSERLGEQLQRLVITAARFDDDSSKNAQRGLSCAEIDLFHLFSILFKGKTIVACAEDATAQGIPPQAKGVEKFVMNRPFRPVQQWFARWEMTCESSEDLLAATAAGATVFLISPQLKETDDSISFSDLPPTPDEEPLPSELAEELRQGLFYLAGGRTGPKSFGLYQPTALFELLSRSEAVVLLHRDKHAECLGIYVESKESVDALATALTDGMSCVTVPFSIPPMLARWDRAIWELQSKWNEAEQGPFPLPESLAESGDPTRSRHHQSAASPKRPVLKENSQQDPSGESEVLTDTEPALVDPSKSAASGEPTSDETRPDSNETPSSS